MCGKLSNFNRILYILTYIQVQFICLAHNKCEECMFFVKSDECALDMISGTNKELSKVLFSKLANEHCKYEPCKKCPYITSKFNANERCDFFILLDKIGVTSKW